MKNAFRVILIVLLLLFLCPSNLNATSGFLTSSTIKRCPNGILYGEHAGHWHKAVKRNGRYYATGSAIKNDPCLPKSDNNDLKYLKVDGHKLALDDELEYETYKNTIKIEAKPYDSKAKVTNNYKGLKVGRNIIKIKVVAENGDKQYYTLYVKRLTMNTSIESLSIDDNNITVSNQMEYETYNKDINVNIVPSEENVKVTTNYKTLNVGENNIKIVLTASNGDKSVYYLNVILKEEKVVSITEDTSEIEEVPTEEEIPINEDESEVKGKSAEEVSISEDESEIEEEPVEEEQAQVEEMNSDISEEEDDDFDPSGVIIPLAVIAPSLVAVKKLKRK